MTADRFEGKTAIVTGGASGIGRATALRLAAEGATVVAADVNADLLATLGEEATAPGIPADRIRTAVADVSSEEGAAGLVAGALDHLGHLDVLVNAAGVLAFSHTHEQSFDGWQRLISINLTGTFLVTRAALPHLLATRGALVNLASTAAHKGQAWAAAYAASKGGVLAFSRALAVEYAGQGVRVNTISPGAIDTPITGAFHLPEGADAKLLNRAMPMTGFGTPEGIAAAIAFVASAEASHMNGADLLVDGATLA